MTEQEVAIYENNEHEHLQESDTHHSSLLLQFIRSLRLGMDLTTISTPAFMLKPISFLEMQAKYSQPIPDLISPQINKISGIECMLVLVKWLVCNWAQTPQTSFTGIKPYNPILGEQFHCTWNHGDSVSVFHSEQVSHHPPISCCVMYNKERRFVMQISGELKSSFKGNSADATFSNSHIQFDFLERGESYIIDMPVMTICGLIFGSARVEHTGKAHISCAETGIKTEICFAKNHTFTCHITNSSGAEIYKVEGNLIDEVYILDCSQASTTTHHSSSFFSLFSRHTVESAIVKRHFFSIPEIRKGVNPRETRPFHEQDSNESRRVWHPVTYALKIGDVSKAAHEKHEIEERQRRKDSSEYTPILFKLVENSHIYKYNGLSTLNL